MPANTHFFLIHLLAFIALLINVGPQQDGWDNLNKRFTLTGKIATALIAIDLIAFVHFLIITKATVTAYGSFYLGYGITVIAFSIPFTAISHYASSPKPIKINMVGWIGISLGASGFVSSLFLVFFSKIKVATNMSEDYVAILGHFITVASAMIALTESLNASASQTPANAPIDNSPEALAKAEDRKWERRDLKRVAIKVIMIGFVVSAVNSIIENRKGDEVKKNLLRTKSFITDSLDTHISQLDKQITTTKKDLGKVHTQLQGLLTTVSTLGAISTSLDALNKNVAKRTEVDELLKKSVKLNENDEQQKVAIEKLNTDLQKELDKYNKLNEQFRKNDEAKQQAINDLQTKLANYNKNLLALEQTVKSNTALKQLQQSIANQRTALTRIEQGMVSQAKVQQLSQNVSALKTQLTSFEARIKRRIEALTNLTKLRPSRRDTAR
jgi:hypothetical protein